MAPKRWHQSILLLMVLIAWAAILFSSIRRMGWYEAILPQAMVVVWLLFRLRGWGRRKSL
jgi:hypothetical protein